MAKPMIPGSREEQELTRLMETYGAMLVSLCASALRDRHLAQDAVQETFLKAYRHLHQLAQADSERAWLIRIALNTCRDFQRTWWARHVDRRVPLDTLPEAGAPDASRDILDQVQRLPRGSTQMWPISPASPRAPPSSLPPCTMPPPMPVPKVTSSTSSRPRPAPRVASR